MSRSQPRVHTHTYQCVCVCVCVCVYGNQWRRGAKMSVKVRCQMLWTVDRSDSLDRGYERCLSIAVKYLLWQTKWGHAHTIHVSTCVQPVATLQTTSKPYKINARPSSTWTVSLRVYLVPDHFSKPHYSPPKMSECVILKGKCQISTNRPIDEQFRPAILATSTRCPHWHHSHQKGDGTPVTLHQPAIAAPIYEKCAFSSHLSIYPGHNTLQLSSLLLLWHAHVMHETYWEDTKVVNVAISPT